MLLQIKATIGGIRRNPPWGNRRENSWRRCRQRINAQARRLSDLARASVHYCKTEDEVARFTTAVAALAPNVGA
jgi:selenocysteine lyase/cysteine desulfurase